MKFSTSLLAIPSLFVFTTSAAQQGEIRSCGVPGGQYQSPITGLYDVYDGGESICGGREVQVDWNAGARFDVSLYGTRCIFHVETFWPDARNGDKFGYVNCPGVTNIPAIRDETDYSGFCGLSTTGCRNRAKMEWDGCLSCGDAVCGASSECSSGCCDASSDICSTPENSTCK